MPQRHCPGLVIYGVAVLWPTALCSLVAKSSLQDLSIAVKQVNAADEWPTALPHGLTRLVISLEDVGQAPEASQQGVLPTAATSSFLDNVQNMQRLQELQLRLCEFDPALLSSIAGLWKLHLDRCQLLPGNQAGTRALLRVMQGLTQLQGIHLCLQSGCTSGVAPELFAALTASAQLTSLELVPVGGQPLPWGAVRRIFPAGCSMPQLQVLQIKGVEDVTAVDMYAWAMGGRDLVAIANACPGLRELKLNCVVRPGASCAGLQRPPEGLRTLLLAGVAFRDAAAAAVAKLTKLKSLSWCRAPQLTDVGFQRLTALTRLYCDGRGLSEALTARSCTEAEMTLMNGSYA